MSEPLAVLRVGVCCPVGLDAAQAASSLRAGVTRKSETPLLDQRGRPVVIGHLADELLPKLRPGRVGPRPAPLAGRMLRLAAPALAEVLSRQFADVALPVYLAAPQAPLDGPEYVPEGFLAALADQARRGVDLDSSRVITEGRTGLFSAIVAARDELLIPGRAKFVIVGGVDSYLDAGRIEALERAGRLRTSGPQDAFTPGEAAAFVILATAGVCRRHSLAPLAWITTLGQASAADQRLASEGLAAACAAAFASTSGEGEPLRLVMAGLNGESKSAREWGIALVRNGRRFAESVQVEHPAEYIGDAGAALAPLMLATAALQLRARTLLGPALLWACADSGRRGALILYAGG